LKIVVSSESKRRYSRFYYDLLSYTQARDVSLIEIPSKNPWVRDYLPVEFNQHLIQFTYDPFYHDDPKYWEPQPPPEIELNYEKRLIIQSKLILDGGAVLIDDVRRYALISKAFYHDDFEALFKQYHYSLIFLNSDPFDFTGHMDGIYRIVNGEIIYTRVLDSLPDNEWHLSNLKLLATYGYKPIPVPDLGSGVDLETFRGTYLNFLIAGNSVLLPRTQTKLLAEQVKHAEEEVETFFVSTFGLEPHWIDCQEPTHDGGSLHCLTYVIE
jgi:hypothetical protein